jgi:hypothetical protein
MLLLSAILHHYVSNVYHVCIVTVLYVQYVNNMQTFLPDSVNIFQPATPAVAGARVSLIRKRQDCVSISSQFIRASSNKLLNSLIRGQAGKPRIRTRRKFSRRVVKTYKPGHPTRRSTLSPVIYFDTTDPLIYGTGRPTLNVNFAM